VNETHFDLNYAGLLKKIDSDPLRDALQGIIYSPDVLKNVYQKYLSLRLQTGIQLTEDKLEEIDSFSNMSAAARADTELKYEKWEKVLMW
jgi:hypothetical protein